MNTRFGEVERRMDARFGDVERRMDVRFGEVERRMDARFGDVERRIDARLTSLERLIVSFGDKFDAITRTLDRESKDHQKMIDEHEKRLQDLERAGRAQA